MRYQSDTAMKLAAFLEQHPSVKKLNYPRLENHPAHQRARELFDGFSAMLSFEIKGKAATAQKKGRTQCALRFIHPW